MFKFLKEVLSFKTPRSRSQVKNIVPTERSDSDRL
jgi:hypothetical protein